MTIALDLGCHRLRSLRRDGDELIGRSCHTFYSVFADSDSHRTLMKQAQVPYGICESELVLMGDDAVDYAELFQIQAQRLLPGGIIPQVDPLARQILASFVEALLPEPIESGELCCMTLPGNSVDRLPSKNRELEFLTRLVRLRGYTPQILSSAMAVILAELVHENFTGIGISFGAATCEASLAHCGIELAHCTIERGGHWIDQEMARKTKAYKWDCHGEKYLDVNGCMLTKEQSVCSLTQVHGGDEELLAELYRDLVTHVVQEAAKCFGKAPRIQDVPQPVSVVCSGGPARIAGFDALLNHALDGSAFPVAIKDVRLAVTSDLTVARGCLISGELEAQTQADELVAA